MRAGGVMRAGEVVGGRYELSVLLGRGGMGEVWAALDRALRREVAVKLLHVASGVSPELPARFEREAVAVARISAPNVVAVYDSGAYEDLLYLVMEKLGGGTLADLIRDEAPMPSGRAVALARQVCAGLGAAHAAGVVHCDIKPHNVMLAADGVVKVVDFGLAGFTVPVLDLARSSELTPAGTPLYSAPEQFEAARGDERSDLYALGTVLFEMLSGRRPHGDLSGYAIVSAKIARPAPRLESVRPDVPAALAALVAELLERDPGRRPASAGEVGERLACLHEPQGHDLRAAARPGPRPSEPAEPADQWVPNTGAALPYPVPAPASPPAPSSSSAGTVPSPVPAQLPADVAHFTGRAGQLEALTELGAEAGRAVVITAIGGTAGIGKTALAVHWAHRVAGSFPDGQLYVNLRGFDPAAAPLEAGAAVRGFLDALGVAPERVPADPDAQAGLYRSLLAGRRMLVVLDNARDPAQVRPLLPGTPGCLVLVTSRSQLSGLTAVDGARALTLDLLTPHEAGDLLARRLGTGRVAAEPAAAGELAELCARLPLALNITAARAAARPGFPLAVFAAELREARDRLAALDAGDATADIRAVFSWSYRALSPAAARTFRLLGLHPGPDATAPATASLTAASRQQARAALNELASAHLLAEHAPGRYAFHDLLREYAADQARTHDTDEERQEAICRTLDHYLHTAYAADRLLRPVRMGMIAPTSPRPGAAPEELADDQQAWRWLEAEHPVLLAAITQAAAHGFDLHACQLLWTLVTFFDRRGNWHDSLPAQAVSLVAAQRLGDLAEQAFAYRVLGVYSGWLGSYADADSHVQRALELYRQLGDHAGQGATHNVLAASLEQQGRRYEALNHAKQALEQYRAAGHQAGQARALNAVGWFCSLLGDHQQALDYCQQALDLHHDLGNQTGMAGALDSLGHANHHLGHHRQAIEYYRQALDLFRTIRHRYEQAATLSRLGDTYHAVGDYDAARDAWEQALAVFEDLQHPDAEPVRVKLGAG
jgi:serine/threonine protein kinase/tetratricopeptide (TPR) repeat protein